MAGDPKKYGNFFLDPFIFVSFLRRAAKLGIHPTDLASEWVVERLTQELVEEKYEGLLPADKMFIINARHEERVAMNAQLKRLAFTALNSPAEEDHELFMAACEAMNVSPHDISREVSNYREAPGSGSGKLTVVAKAMEWLAMLVPIGSEKSAQDILAAGDEAGYSKNILENAKRKLGMTSERRSNNWVWMWPDQAIQ